MGWIKYRSRWQRYDGRDSQTSEVDYEFSISLDLIYSAKVTLYHH